jgi:hypothetical protein
MFIPVFNSGGGGPSNKETTAVLFAILGLYGGFAYWYHRQYIPDVYLSIKYDKYPNNKCVNIKTKEPNGPVVLKRTSHNIDCLLAKGYKLQNVNERKSLSTKTYNLCNVWQTDKNNKSIPILKDEFIADCKECNVSTDVHYKYKTIFKNKKLVKKNIMWHKSFEDRLE